MQLWKHDFCAILFYTDRESLDCFRYVNYNKYSLDE